MCIWHQASMLARCDEMEKRQSVLQGWFRREYGSLKSARNSKVATGVLMRWRQMLLHGACFKWRGLAEYKKYGDELMKVSIAHAKAKMNGQVGMITLMFESLRHVSVLLKYWKTEHLRVGWRQWRKKMDAKQGNTPPHALLRSRPPTVTHQSCCCTCQNQHPISNAYQLLQNAWVAVCCSLRLAAEHLLAASVHTCLAWNHAALVYKKKSRVSLTTLLLMYSLVGKVLATPSQEVKSPMTELG